MRSTGWGAEVVVASVWVVLAGYSLMHVQVACLLFHISDYLMSFCCLLVILAILVARYGFYSLGCDGRGALLCRLHAGGHLCVLVVS